MIANQKYVNLFFDMGGDFARSGTPLNYVGQVEGLGHVALRAYVKGSVIERNRGMVAPIQVLKLIIEGNDALKNPVLGATQVRVHSLGSVFRNAGQERVGVTFLLNEARQTRALLNPAMVGVGLVAIALTGLGLYLSSNQTEANHDSWLASSITTVKNFLSSDEAQTALAVASYIV